MLIINSNSERKTGNTRFRPWYWRPMRFWKSHWILWVLNIGRMWRSKDENLRRFRAFFGIGPQAAGKVYADLIQTSKSFELKYFFLTLNWLKSYDTELILSGWWRMHEQSIRQSVWSVSTAIQNLKDKKVSSFWESPAMQNPSHFLHRLFILSLGCVWQL